MTTAMDDTKDDHLNISKSAKTTSRKGKVKVDQSKLVNINGKIKGKEKGRKYSQICPEDKLKLEAPNEGDSQKNNTRKND